VHWLLLSAKKPCLAQAMPTCSKRLPIWRNSACVMPGWCSFMGASQSTCTVPTLHEVVEVARPTRPLGKVPVCPCAVMLERMPSLTSMPTASAGPLPSPSPPPA
jgi:hypothetical protein